MHRYLTPLFLLLTSASFSQVRFSPQKPVIDGVVSFTYTPTGPLEKETAIQAVYTRYGSPAQMRLSQVETAAAQPVGNTFVGTIKVPFKEVSGLLVAFRSEKTPTLIDHNDAHFYPVPLYTKSGGMVSHAQGGQGSVMLRSVFPYALKIKPDWAWVVAQYEAELERYPDSRPQYWADLARARIRRGEQTGATDYKQAALTEIDAYLTDPKQTLTPADLRLAADLYTYLKEPQLAQKALARTRSVDHSAPEAQQARVAEIIAETDLGKKRTLFDKFVATLPKSPYRVGAVSSVAEAYFNAGKLRELVDFMGGEAAPETDPALLLRFARQLATENRGMAQAGWLADRAIWTFGKHPVAAGNKVLLAERAGQLRQAQSIRAHALDQLGQYGPALTAYRSVWGNVPAKQTDPATNERIWLSARQASRADSAFPFIIGVMKAGRSTAGLRTNVREWQSARMGNAQELASYQANMTLLDEIDRRALVTDHFVDEAAPIFILRTPDGRRVSLASLRGKVVVLDFWATWCEPCRASMPAKRQVRDRFRRDAGVQFLFVNTHETASAAGVRQYLARQPPLGLVPLDQNRKIADAYGVKLIPSSLIIDPNGRVRYRITGYSDNAQATTDELVAAIDALK